MMFEPTYLANKLNLDAVVLQPLAWVLQSDIHFPTDRLAVVEKKVFVFLSIFALVFSLLPRFSVTEDYINFCTLTKTKETHYNAKVKKK